MAALNALDEKIDIGLPSKIIDHLYLGTINHAWNDQILQQLKITHIVCCKSGAIPKSKANVKRLTTPMHDRGYSVLKEKRQKSFPIIEKAIKNKQNVLIHCKSSVNRAPCITVAFLMYYEQINIEASTCNCFQMPFIDLLSS